MTGVQQPATKLTPVGEFKRFKKNIDYESLKEGLPKAVNWYERGLVSKADNQ